MAQILHKCARTTEAMRREIQNSQESLKTLAARFSVNPKTIHKWRSRKERGVSDQKSGPKEKKRTQLTRQDEAMIITFRQKTQLPLDDCLDALIDHIPYLSRSALYRCLKRHGLSRVPQQELTTQEKKQFKEYPIGYVHMDITELRVEKEKLYLFVAICRVSKYAYAFLYESQTLENTLDFFNRLLLACPFKIHTILTDNGSQFTYTKNILQRGRGPQKRHGFDLACSQAGIRHRRTKPYHPQTNGQVERFNRTLKEATVHLYHYASKSQLFQHLKEFILAYNCGKKLSAIKRNTPMQECQRWWIINPNLFNVNPNHQLMELYT